MPCLLSSELALPQYHIRANTNLNPAGLCAFSNPWPKLTKNTWRLLHPPSASRRHVIVVTRKMDLISATVFMERLLIFM